MSAAASASDSQLNAPKRPKLNHIHNKEEKKTPPVVVGHEDWVAARKALQVKERELTRAIDEVVKARRELPWEKVSTDYVLQSPSGPVKLSQLLTAQKPDLVVQHVMFGCYDVLSSVCINGDITFCFTRGFFFFPGPADERACPVCCSWLDQWNGSLKHLEGKGAHFVAIAAAPVAKLEAFRQNKGYKFPFLSEEGSTFNADYKVTRPPGAAGGPDKFFPEYNYGVGGGEYDAEQWPGLSVFHRGDDGTIFHTYSCYARGLDILNGFHALMDILPFGRQGFHEKHDY